MRIKCFFYAIIYLKNKCMLDFLKIKLSFSYDKKIFFNPFAHYSKKRALEIKCNDRIMVCITNSNFIGISMRISIEIFLNILLSCSNPWVSSEGILDRCVASFSP